MKLYKKILQFISRPFNRGHKSKFTIKAPPLSYEHVEPIFKESPIKLNLNELSSSNLMKAMLGLSTDEYRQHLKEIRMDKKMNKKEMVVAQLKSIEEQLLYFREDIDFQESFPALLSALHELKPTALDIDTSKIEYHLEEITSVLETIAGHFNTLVTNKERKPYPN